MSEESLESVLNCIDSYAADHGLSADDVRAIFDAGLAARAALTPAREVSVNG